MRKCAVIGSKGYIGKHLVFYLKKLGWKVEGYDVFECQEEGYTQCNLTQKEEIQKINLNVDYVFMFAGLTGTYVGFDKYETYVNVNEIGLLNLLNAIRVSD